MSVIETSVIDAISIDSETKEVKLTISDHLSWEDPLYHFYVLQEKINAYLSFCESGQIYSVYPNARGKKIRINVVTKFKVPEEGLYFYAKVGDILSDSSISISHMLLNN